MGDSPVNEASNVSPIRAESEYDVRAELLAVLTSDRSLVQAQIAREIGVGQSAFSQWKGGTYGGDNDDIERRVRTWLDARKAKAASGDRMPRAPEFEATPTSQRIISALGYAQIAGDIALIYGGAGLGKTTAIRQYKATGLNVWHATMTPASASVVTALEVICDALGINEQGGAARLFKAIVRRVRSTGGLLVVDEAQHLSVAALDQIRSIHDETEIGIALVGNESVYARMTGGNRAAFLDRLYSRVGKRLALKQSTDADIDALIAAWGIADKACRRTLIDIARKPGALRTLTKVLRLASMHALAAKEAVCCTHVATAWRELGGME